MYEFLSVLLYSVMYGGLKYQDVFNDQNVIDNIRLTLSNQVKLNESPFFKDLTTTS